MIEFALLIGTSTGVEVVTSPSDEALCNRAMQELTAGRAPHGVMIARRINDGDDYLVMYKWPGAQGMGLTTGDLP